MQKFMQSRLVAVAGAATVLVAIGGVGAATASGQITGQDIQNYTIRTVDLARGSVTYGKLAPGVQDKLNQHAKDGKDGTNGTNGTDGKDGTNGTDGKDGANGVSGYEVRSYDYDSVSGGGIATMTCPVGKVATGGGFRWNDEAAMTNGTTTLASYPGVMDWDTNKPKATGDPQVDDRGWIVQANKPNNVNPGALTVYVVCELAN